MTLLLRHLPPGRGKASYDIFCISNYIMALLVSHFDINKNAESKDPYLTFFFVMVTSIIRIHLINFVPSDKAWRKPNRNRNVQAIKITPLLLSPHKLGFPLSQCLRTYHHDGRNRLHITPLIITM